MLVLVLDVLPEANLVIILANLLWNHVGSSFDWQMSLEVSLMHIGE